MSRREELYLDVGALTQHAHVLGPTGRGKTTLLCTLYLEAARLGLGAMYAEPKGDAIDDLCRRIPTERLADVVLLDFGNEHYPPALNLLACPSGEEDIHAEALVAISAGCSAAIGGRAPRTSSAPPSPPCSSTAERTVRRRRWPTCSTS